MSAKSNSITFSKSMNLHYNKESNLVFKSAKEKLVIGRLDEAKKFIDFDEKTLELCDEFGFEPDPSKIDNEVSEVNEAEVVSSSQEDENEEESKQTEVKEEKEKKNEPIQAEKKEIKNEPVKEIKKETSLQPLLQSLENLFKEKDQKIKELELHLALNNTEIWSLKQSLNKYADILNSLNNLKINLNPNKFE